MDKLFKNTRNISLYLDDILITGCNIQDHRSKVREVLGILKKANKSKCVFEKSEVKYLGHVINANGMRPILDKLEVIRNALEPKNVTQLKAFLGMLNYYARFIPNRAHILGPLHNLLKKNAVFKWNDECKNAYESVKEMLCKSKLLVHYDPKKELILTCDASLYGIGAILSHIMPDGTEQPTTLASRSLTKAESN